MHFSHRLFTLAVRSDLILFMLSIYVCFLRFPEWSFAVWLKSYIALRISAAVSSGFCNNTYSVRALNPCFS